jgi:hypothetical membrane protein
MIKPIKLLLFLSQINETYNWTNGFLSDLGALNEIMKLYKTGYKCDRQNIIVTL